MKKTRPIEKSASERANSLVESEAAPYLETRLATGSAITGSTSANGRISASAVRMVEPTCRPTAA